MNNTVCGKTMEDVRKRTDFEMVNTPERFQKQEKHPITNIDIASLLDRCLLEMDMAHAIPGVWSNSQTCRKVGSFGKNWHKLPSNSPYRAEPKHKMKFARKFIQNISVQM